MARKTTKTRTSEQHIEYVPIEQLCPFAGNPRKIDEEEMKKLRRSIREFGFIDPAIVRRSDNQIIGGPLWPPIRRLWP